MKKKPDNSSKAKLRRQAEAKLLERKKKTAAPSATETDTMRLIHELQVHQIKLEIQNEELAQSREKDKINKMALILDMAPNSITIHDLEGRFLYANQITFDLHGFNRDELMALTLHQLDVPDSSNLIPQRMQELLNRGEAIFEVAHYRKDGSILPMEVSAKVITWNNKKAILSVATDITKRKQAEAALRKSEKNLREAQHLAHIGSWDWDATTDRITWSEEYYRIYGFDPRLRPPGYEEHLKAYTPESAARLDASVKHSMQTGEGYQLDMERVLADGTQQWITARGEAKRDANGQIVGLHGTAQDITELKKAEKTLRESEKSLREAQHVAHLGSWQWTAATDTVKWSEELYHINGRDPNLPAPSYTEMSSCYTPESWERLSTAVAKALQTGESYKLDLEIVLPDGTTRHTLAHGKPVHDNSGKIAGLHGTVQDITERKQKEKELLNLKTAVNFSGEAVFMTDREGVITFVNPEFTRLYGYSPDEIIGKSTPRILKSGVMKEEEYEYFWQTLVNEQVVKGELINKTKDDRLLTIEGSANPILDNQGEIVGFLAIQHDITERKQAEKQLKDTLETLKKSVGTTIQVMASAVERRDPYTSGHQIRSTTLALAIAIEMGLPQEKIDAIQMASSIHDIGKLSIPAEILSKPTKLSEIEFSLIKQHSYQGYEILKDVESPWPLAEIVYQHHERMDGSGYPRNLKGDEIMIEARIIGVADVVESMAFHRPYRPALGIDAALTEIEKNKDIIYDERVVDACLRLFREKGFSLK